MTIYSIAFFGSSTYKSNFIDQRTQHEIWQDFLFTISPKNKSSWPHASWMHPSFKSQLDDHDTFGNIQSTHWLFHRDSSHPKLKLEGCQKSWMFEAKLSLSWFLLEVLAREKREMWLVWTLKLGMSSKCTHTHTKRNILELHSVWNHDLNCFYTYPDILHFLNWSLWTELADIVI